MTAATKNRLELAAIVLGVGIAWGVLTAQVAGKAEQSDFVADTTRVHSDLRSLMERVDRTNAAVTETNARLREIICIEKPAGCR